MAGENQAPSTDHVHYGDRVVLHRTQRPNRGDVVMFEWTPPADSKSGEKKAPAVMSMAERVIGLPGETVEICSGDVFINGKRWQKRPYESPEMWTVVNDTRYEPAKPEPQSPHWEPASDSTRWKRSGSRWVCSEGASAQGLRFTGRLADLLPYDGRDATWTPLYDESAPLLGDIRLQCEIDEFQGSGGLTFDWEFRGQKVTANVVAPGNVELITGDTIEPVRAPVAGGLHSGMWLTFAVRDGRAYVMRDDAVVVSANLGPQDIEYAKNRLVGAKAEPCALRISAARASVALSRIVLARDVYYRSTEEMSVDPGVVPHGTLNHPCTVAAGSFYLLGDHSQRSLDSRILGNVPTKEILGVLWGVFWPWEHWRDFR